MKSHFKFAALGGLILAAVTALPPLSHAMQLGLDLDANVSAELRGNNGNKEMKASGTADVSASATTTDEHDNNKDKEYIDRNEKNDDNQNRFGIFGRIWSRLTKDEKHDWVKGSATTTASTTIDEEESDDGGPNLFFLRTVSVEENSTVVLWLSSDRATGEIWVETDDQVDTRLVSTDSDDSFSFFHKFKIENLEADTTYYVKVASTDKDGNTTISTLTSFTTKVE